MKTNTKQGSVFFTVLSLLILAAVAVYLLVSVLSAAADPFTTTEAIRYEGSDYVTAEAVVFREEQLLTSDWPIIVPALEEGDKVGAGQRLAAGFRSEQEAAGGAQLQETQRELARMQAVAASELTADTVQEMDDRIADAVIRIQTSLNAGDWSAAQDSGWELQLAVMSRTADDTARQQAAERALELESEEEELKNAGEEAEVLTAPAAGWYSASADGLEEILTPETVLLMQPSELSELKNRKGRSTDGAYGRLVTGGTWYLAAVLPEESARQAAEEGTVQVELTEAGLEAQMQVVQCGDPDEDGNCAVVFSCDRGMDRAAGLRFVSVNVVLRTCTGLRIPKNAVRPERTSRDTEDTADGDTFRTGVYVVVGGRAVFKEVEILLDTGNAYVVREDRTDTDSLWAGDEVIVSARDLYDGKVVQ